MQGDHVVFITL